MAGLQEIALGIASVLQGSPAPEPLPVTFVGQSIEEAAELLRRIVGECRDAGVPLHHVQLDPELARYFRDQEESIDIPIVTKAELGREARFFRRPPNG